jgi:hypothetical protein
MGERRGLTGVVIDILTASWVTARVVLFVGIAMAIFLVSYLAYFTVPFVFIILVLALLGMTGGIRQLGRFRAWVRSLGGAGGQ